MNIKILKEPLNQRHIKSRKEGYGQVGYITGSHAISEANRAFEYKWSAETLDMNLVQTEMKPKKDKQGNDTNIMLNYVGYTCKVKVTVDGLIREGYGFGQGIDKDLGKAHESATKEAETDALKRALRTFGDIFGLALYEKDNQNITNESKESYQIITDEQVKYIRKLNQTIKIDEKELCTFFMIDKLEDLKGRDYNKMIEIINKQIENKKAKDKK
ncbi:Rad52/Rad22 family DNA repair protein [Arcobacter arenosus]|uniref:DNA repair protein Rad52 n=1 Tax=Arcobacter arenosus TaxID=2576037 RepID=A0A5R8Y4S4_9BACT|nr:Rad52/Rad22 family DNA repair protein [Arcobacter arenosus]TLP41066.1 hypothetical protein FDK22_03330 [Arcobacter arenosus]